MSLAQVIRPVALAVRLGAPHDSVRSVTRMRSRWISTGCRNRTFRTVTGTFSVTDIFGVAVYSGVKTGGWWVTKIGISRAAQLAASTVGRVSGGMGIVSVVATIVEIGCRYSGYGPRSVF